MSVRLLSLVAVALLCVLLACPSLQKHSELGPVMYKDAHIAVAAQRDNLLKPYDSVSWNVLNTAKETVFDLVMKGNGELDAGPVEGDWRSCKLRITTSCTHNVINWALGLLNSLGCQNTIVTDLSAIQFLKVKCGVLTSLWNMLLTPSQEVFQTNTNWGTKWYGTAMVGLKPSMDGFSEELKRLHNVKFGDVYKLIIQNPKIDQFQLDKLHKVQFTEEHFGQSIPTVFQRFYKDNEHAKACFFAGSIFALAKSGWVMKTNRVLGTMMRTVSMSTWVPVALNLPVIEFPESASLLNVHLAMTPLKDFIVSLPHKSQPKERLRLYVQFYRDDIVAGDSLDVALCEATNSLHATISAVMNEYDGFGDVTGPFCTLNGLFPPEHVRNAVSGSQLITLWHALAKMHGCKRSRLEDESSIYCDGLKLKSRVYLPLLGSHNDFKLTVYSSKSMGGYLPIEYEDFSIQNYRAAMIKYRNFKLLDIVSKMSTVQQLHDHYVQFKSALGHFRPDKELTLSQFINKAKQAWSQNRSLPFCQVVKHFSSIFADTAAAETIFGEEINEYISNTDLWGTNL